MKTTTTSIHRIASITRLNSSTNGNPRFAFTFEDGREAISSSDCAFNYEVGNPGMREGDLVRVHWTRAERISYMQPVI